MKRFINQTVFFLTYVLYWLYRRLFYSAKINFDPHFKNNFSDQIIIISNHKSLLDAWHVINNLPFQIFIRTIPIRVYATKKFDHKIAKNINRIKLIDLLHCLYGAIVIPKESDFEAKIKPLIQAIIKRESVLIFPEGRVINEDNIGEFKRGVVEVYTQTKCPILPVSIKVVKSNFIRKTIIINYGQTTSIPSDILDIPLAENRYRQAAEYLRAIVVKLYNV